MKKNLFMYGIVVALTAGCGGTAVYENPYDRTQVPQLRQKGKISADEMNIAMERALQQLKTSEQFARFCRRYQEERGNDATPLMEIGKIKNDTYDRDLKTDMLTNALFTKASETLGIVRVTMATGETYRASGTNAVALRHDKEFDRKTVVKKGRAEAPSISLEGQFITNRIKQDRNTMEVNQFTLNLLDLETRTIIWSCSEALGTVHTQSVFGL